MPAMANLANLLSGVRLLLVPILLVLAWNGWHKAFLFVLICSLSSDVADGFVARKLHQATALGAKLDSWGDLVTAVALPFCAWWLRPDALREQASFIAAGILFYVAAILFGFVKFRRLTSYHTWGAKIIACVFGATLIVLFAGGPGWVFRIAMPLLILTELEEIAITWVLSEPKTNVPSLWHALRLRRIERTSQSVERASQLPESG
jgi:CDP-diacylglycerol--glycerol-3-phosphate 3-phosphatidyltransferase